MTDRHGIKRCAVPGNHLPRQCGIATFTTHLADALTALATGRVSEVLNWLDRHGTPP